MEDLPDIASGQSHRAALHAVMRAREAQSAQHQDHGNRSRPTPSAGRGCQPIGSRGRGAPLPSNRTSSIGGITKPGRLGPPHRSATVSFGLDPALNINNDPSEDDSRSCGRGGYKDNRGRGRAGGNLQQRSPIASRQPQRQQRPAINFTNKIADPSNFMFSYRQSSQMPVASAQANNSTQPQNPEHPKPLLVANHEKKKNVTSTNVSPPFETPKVSSRVVPVEKTAQFTKPKAKSTASDTSGNKVVGHMGSYPVETPTPPARSVPPRKILPLRRTKLKTQAPATPTNTLQPPDLGPPDMEIQWKVPAGEHPRKKETLISGPTTPVTPKKKTRVIDQEIEPKEVKSRPLPCISKDIPKDTAKAVTKEQKDDDKQSWSGSLLDTANPPIPGHASDVLVPAPSPAAVDLHGVDFASDISWKTIEERVEYLEGMMKRAGGITGPTNPKIPFEDWLKHADPNEAARIRKTLRSASFTQHRSPSPRPSESSAEPSSSEPSPVQKPKARALIISPTKSDQYEFADRFSDRFSGLDISKVRSGAPLESVKNPKTLDPPAKAIAIPMKVIPQSRSVAKKTGTLNDSIYASKENRVDTPSESTQAKTDDGLPRVKVIGVQPFNLSRRK